MNLSDPPWLIVWSVFLLVWWSEAFVESRGPSETKRIRFHLRIHDVQEEQTEVKVETKTLRLGYGKTTLGIRAEVVVGVLVLDGMSIVGRNFGKTLR